MSIESEFSEFTLDAVTGKVDDVRKEYTRLMSDKPRSQNGETSPLVDAKVMAQAMENLNQRKNEPISPSKSDAVRPQNSNSMSSKELQELVRFAQASEKKRTQVLAEQPLERLANANVMLHLPDDVDKNELQKYREALREARVIEEQLKKEGGTQIQVIRDGKITIGRGGSQPQKAGWEINGVEEHLSRGPKFELRRTEDKGKYSWAAINTGSNDWLVEGTSQKLNPSPKEQPLPEKNPLILQLGKLRIKVSFVQDKSLIVVGLLRSK